MRDIGRRHFLLLSYLGAGGISGLIRQSELGGDCDFAGGGDRSRIVLPLLEAPAPAIEPAPAWITRKSQ